MSSVLPQNNHHNDSNLPQNNHHNDSNVVAILLECDPGNTLGGSCIRDVHNMANFLLDNKISKNIHVLLTDLSKATLKTVQYSHSKDIFKLLDKIILNKGDKMIVLVSGHGFSTRDTDGDEIDGMDEYINVGFQIKDDDLYREIVIRYNTEGINIVLMSDTCHSGTMFDLPYSYDVVKQTFQKISKRSDILRVNAISIAACTDSQLSMCDIGSNVGYGGSLTVGLLEYPEILLELLEMRYHNIIKIFDRLKKLNQQGILSITYI
jgi:hypothetical protein